MRKRSVVAVLGALLWCGAAVAAVGVGDDGPMYQTLDENMQPVDMADFIDGRPLVLAVGSAS
jgi:hypothetical protein